MKKHLIGSSFIIIGLYGLQRTSNGFLGLIFIICMIWGLVTVAKGYFNS